jgi:uncharacterized membrane protein
MIESLGTSLFGINLLAYFTILFRPKLYHTKLYKPMLVNIRLSIMPIGILMATAFFCLIFGQWYENTGSTVFLVIFAVLLAVGFLAWLLMLPNSGYLITELNFNHRDHDKTEVPLWYDIVSILSLAMSGVLNMCFNVLMLQFWAIAVANSIYSADMMGLWADIVADFLLLLCSVGIYLGRYLRLNSWDVKHPVGFAKKVKAHFNSQGAFKNFFLFVALHTLFFVLFYQAAMGNIAQVIFGSLWRG